MESSSFFFITTIIFLVLYLKEKKKRKVFFAENLQLKYLLEKEKKKVDSNELDVIFPYSKKSTNKTGIKRPDLSFEDLVRFKENKIDKQYLYPIKDLEDTGNFFFGKKVVITGDFKAFETRNEIAKLLWEAGADVDVSVGKNTEVLIYGLNPGSTKLANAEEYNVQMINETEFLSHFNL